MAQAYASTLGTQASATAEGNNSPNSMFGLGYTSYFIQKDNVEIGDQQFFVGSPTSTNFYLDGCPNLEPGQTSANTNFVCPRRSQKVGAFKFTVIGLLSGARVNRLNTADPPLNTSTRAWESWDRDLADYKTMLYRTTLDIGGMGADVVTEVKGNCSENGKSFFNISADADLADCALHITGSQVYTLVYMI